MLKGHSNFLCSCMTVCTTLCDDMYYIYPKVSFWDQFPSSRCDAGENKSDIHRREGACRILFASSEEWSKMYINPLELLQLQKHLFSHLKIWLRREARLLSWFRFGLHLANEVVQYNKEDDKKEKRKSTIWAMKVWKMCATTTLESGPTTLLAGARPWRV